VSQQPESETVVPVISPSIITGTRRVDDGIRSASAVCRGATNGSFPTRHTRSSMLRRPPPARPQLRGTHAHSACRRRRRCYGPHVVRMRRKHSNREPACADRGKKSRARLCNNRVRNRLSAGGESHERTRLGSGFRSSQKSESDFQRFLDDSGLGKRGFARKINAVRWTSLGCRLENGPLFPGRRPTKRLVLCIFFKCAFGRGGSFSLPIK